MRLRDTLDRGRTPVNLIKKSSLCPSHFCPASNPVQSLVSERDAELVGEAALEGAIRCSSCGCVWVKDQSARPRVLGTLRSEGRAYRWISAYKAPAARDPDANRTDETGKRVHRAAPVPPV